MSDRRAAAERLAEKFHETYERLAPSFGYETRRESAKPWADVPEQNKRLMIAVCQEILDTFGAEWEARGREAALRDLEQTIRGFWYLSQEHVLNLISAALSARGGTTKGLAAPAEKGE